MDHSGPATHLNVRDVRADALHRILLKTRRRIDSVDDIPRLGELFSWPTEQIHVAIADLVHDGRLADNANGRVIVRKAPS